MRRKGTAIGFQTSHVSVIIPRGNGGGLAGPCRFIDLIFPPRDSSRRRPSANFSFEGFRGGAWQPGDGGLNQWSQKGARGGPAGGRVSGHGLTYSIASPPRENCAAVCFKRSKELPFLSERSGTKNTRRGEKRRRNMRVCSRNETRFR